MLNQKDIIAQNIKIINNKDSFIINNNDEDYIYAPFLVEGGAVFKKGIVLGMQDKMVSGLIIYDKENFYGFSEKYGLSLLSHHLEYNKLNFPINIFQNKEDKNTLQPVEKNISEHFKNLKNTDKIENKNLNIDLEIKDSNNFYIIIPEEYSNSNFIITFDIKYIYDLDSIISNLSLVIINNSNKSLYFKIINDNCYYENNFNNEIIKNTISKIKVEVINENYFIISKNIYSKQS